MNFKYQYLNEETYHDFIYDCFFKEEEDFAPLDGFLILGKISADGFTFELNYKNIGKGTWISVKAYDINEKELSGFCFPIKYIKFDDFKNDIENQIRFYLGK